MTGPPALISAVAKAHQFITFTVPSAMQHAVAYGLDHEAYFYRYFQKSYSNRPQLSAMASLCLPEALDLRILEHGDQGFGRVIAQEEALSGEAADGCGIQSTSSTGHIFSSSRF